jgi:hypothetical protein
LRPAVLLRLIHRRVGSAQNSGCRFAGPGRDSNADAGAYMRAVAVPEINRLTDSLDHAVRDLLCLGGSLHADENGQEFVTAVMNRKTTRATAAATSATCRPRTSAVFQL